MKVLLLGGGGREHAMASHFSKSPLCHQLYIAPGNPGTQSCGINLPLSVLDFDGIKSAILEFQIDLVIVGPEDPLDKGITDFLKTNVDTAHVLVFGPTQMGARLESSKAFAKEFMTKANIPTASFKEFNVSQQFNALHYVSHHALPVVIKADGLAAGKGVVICTDHESARATVSEMFNGSFGAAGQTIVIEQFLSGIEFSVFVLTNGSDYILLPEAKDYKRIGEGDQGLNTGGMGAVSPVPFFDEPLKAKVVQKIIEPTLRQLQAEDISYYGFIFFGLILVGDEPYVIEYNVRMGDPETEVVFPRINTDLLPTILSLFEGSSLQPLSINPKNQVGFYLVSKGYPGDYPKGTKIDISQIKGDIDVFQGGTSIDSENHLISNGGRVLFVSAQGDSLVDARNKALDAANAVSWEDKYFRKDIGQDLEKYI